MVVCAHNEERVIGALVENLHLLNYSDKLYDIFVVADNCTDKTAEVARKAGAQVHERFNDTEKGKGYAMDWMFNRLFKMERQYDAVCVLTPIPCTPRLFKGNEQPSLQRRAPYSGLP